VADTGVGISPSDQRIIFEEFGQVENSMQRRVKGTGLGLPLSRKLAELLGGSVTVKSEVGIGSTFFFHVPIIYAGATLPPENFFPDLDPNKKLILIVEDNHETAFVYSRYLATADFQVHAVASVEQARAFIAQARPSAIILDLLLHAEMTWDFLRELKSEAHSIPVLVMSVNDDEHKIYGLGADAFLVKPFQPESMIAEVIKLTSEAIRPRVLMIDDNEVSRYLLREHIPAAQYEVFEARDGREGLRLARELNPEIIFLDFYMPDLNGMEVLKDLRSTIELAKIPVVLHSTKILDAEELKFFRENTIAIFPKQSLTLPDSATRIRELMKTLSRHAQAEP
jgi:DNA-binding response OmpR family regulator